ncbi:MAG: TonB-dependent receptor [Chitinophagaceae bacterium]|nr:TonB-dependent receptor [Chitinophagaceae bacterium]MCA6453752.1 TonB-dependent receptor [Chitinophagaceae bacterium]MCA6457979.1 TonB-dependent receptor [Chitinophagaceae bacterium]MCA6463692.1 TonB-dependent receptor [Chitinophagaceae bacterium]
MKRLFTFLPVAIVPLLLFSQRPDSIRLVAVADTALPEVAVSAFQSNLQWKAVPAAVALLGRNELARYGTASFVPVMNAVPGIRVEERSPASYRLSIRGSLLRSPFGVRNVKVYWNGIPLTDGGGNTYLNLVDLTQLTAVEIIKGPAASVYGAGTGGAVLLGSDPPYGRQKEYRFTAGILGGPYGLFQQQLGWEYSNAKISSSIQQSHQQADGYREQSASRKDMVKWQLSWRTTRQQLRFMAWYTDLYYQTPGGITLAQMQLNPKLARQPAGSLPGAVQQKAAIYNKTLLAAIQQETSLGKQWVWKNFLMSNHSSIANPFITNYEKRTETNMAAGSQLVYSIRKAAFRFQWVNGAEYLRNHSLIDNFGNRSGNADTVQFRDDIYAVQWFAFSQAQLSLAEKWVLTAGVSVNNQSYRYQRTTDPASTGFVRKNISGVVTPRLAIAYRVSKAISLYLLAAKGLSPPALAEVRPSDGNYYGNLEAEYGWNIEAGIKGASSDNRLQFDVAAYFFRLQNAIVRRTNAIGAEYFVNAGSTRQNGLETWIKYRLVRGGKRWVRDWSLWSSHTYQPYRFEAYQQSGIDYSGKNLTGVPRTIWVTGMDIEIRNGVYLNTSVNATGSLPLTDANDVMAEAYQLVQLKLGYRTRKKTQQFDWFIGVDNLLDQRYSLGNDINALGKRYYNPAPGRNAFAGVRCRF